MMTQEEYMDLLALRRQGNTIAEIADTLGYHPATISKVSSARSTSMSARPRT